MAFLSPVISTNQPIVRVVATDIANKPVEEVNKILVDAILKPEPGQGKASLQIEIHQMKTNIGLIEELQQDVLTKDALLNKMEEAKTRYEQDSAMIAEATKKVEEKQQQMVAAKKNVDADCDRVKKEIEQLGKETQEIEEQEREVQPVTSKIQVEIAGLEQQIEELVSAMSQIKNEAKKTQEQRTSEDQTLLQEINAFQTEIDKLDTAIRSQIEILNTRDLARTTDDTRAQVKEQVQARNKELEEKSLAKVQSIQQELDSCQQEIADKQTTARVLTQDIADIDIKIQQQLHEKERIRQEDKSITSNISNINKQIEQLNNEMEKHQDSLRDLAEAIKELKKENIELNQEIADKNKIQANFKEAISAQSKELSETKQQIADTEGQIVQKTAHSAGLVQNIAGSESIIKTTETEIGGLDTKIETKQTAIETA